MVRRHSARDVREYTKNIGSTCHSWVLTAVLGWEQKMDSTDGTSHGSARVTWNRTEIAPSTLWVRSWASSVLTKGFNVQKTMKTMTLMTVIWIGLLAVGVSPAIADGTFSGSGTVNEIKVDEGKVNISHGPIPELSWPGMTMDFSLAKTASVEKIKVGEVVEFELRKLANGSFVIESLWPKEKSGHSHGH